MSTNRIVGLVIFAVGLLLLGFAWNATTAPLEKMSNALTGRYSNETMWYFGLGLAAVIGGGLLAALDKRK